MNDVERGDVKLIGVEAGGEGEVRSSHSFTFLYCNILSNEYWI